MDVKKMNINQFPRISIVTPCYNQASYLEETIQSVLSQNYNNLEYIIIDGGSDDGSLEIIKKYETQLAFWVSEPDNGQYDAINKGFTHSTGEIMAWLNSDDKLAPHALSIVHEVFTQFPEVNWITGLYPIIWNKKGQAIHVDHVGGFEKQSFYRGANLPRKKGYARSWIQQESTFWRRTLWDCAGAKVNSQLKYAGDFELWARFFEYSHLYGVYGLIGGFRKHECQKTASHLDEYILEALSVLKYYGYQPYSGFSCIFRKYLNHIFAGRFIGFLPKMVINIFVFIGILKKSNIIRWKMDRWEIIMNYLV